MPQVIPYMGTKRQIAGHVADLASECKTGPFLDLFSGMCSVGNAISPARQVWSNDIQAFAHAVAEAHFCSLGPPPSSLSIAEKCGEIFRKHRAKLIKKYSDILSAEDCALSKSDPSQYSNLFEEAIFFANGVRPRKDSSYQLFSKRYSRTYLSTLQSIEIDCIRKASDWAKDNLLISNEWHKWSLIGLCMSISKCSTTTGHFAQPLSPKESNWRRFSSQRSRSIYKEWIESLDSISPIGSTRWRKKNRAFQDDALSLLNSLKKSKDRPAVVYADPPYTKDQYSRYYHLLETAILYDHPRADGRGLYRRQRASSIFSSPANLEFAMEALVERTAKLSSDIIISYPTNGLLKNSHKRIPEIISRHYKQKPTIVQLEHAHSTLGASKGSGRQTVTEVLYLARST